MRKRTSASDATRAAYAPAQGSADKAAVSATEAYAAQFAERYAAQFYRPAAGGEFVSSVGIGTYLGECTEADDATYTNAIATAIVSGVNLIDTAINYRCQRSERAVGVAIGRVLQQGIAREAIVVCTKGGFLPLADRPPESREEYRDYLKREFFSTGVLTPDDLVAGGHSIAPAFVRYSIDRSRKNLGIQSIDLYYLHNPEQQLAAVSPASLRERLRAAFMVLEDAVTRGEIRAYGCATWQALRVAPGSKSHLSLQDLQMIAREVAGEGNHFRAVQLPVNLAMPEAFREATQEIGNKRTLVPALEAARELGLTAVASASLMQAQLTKDLPPSIRELFPGQKTDAQRAIAFVRSLPGVTTALVGTRSLQHLAENLESADRVHAASS
ncbi:MAG TPA: aldo/keto reductase [Gemmatimonadaceae bacterium]|jgi:aryl-alcohol dehydrogenase-like predicted oxidoreductase